MPEVAIVVPVFNNLATLPALATELDSSLEQLGGDWRVIWVDDASNDGSWSWIRDHCHSTPRNLGLRLARNLGQSLAVCTGLAHAPTGAVVVTFDADLEYSPADIGAMVSAVSGPKVFVAGVRPRRSAGRWTSALFNAAVRTLTSYRVGDVGCGFMAIGPDLAAAAANAGPRGLALRPLLSSLASATVSRPVRHRERGSSGTGRRARARIAFDVLAADPRPATRLVLAAAVVFMTSRSGRARGPSRSAASMIAGAAALLMLRRRELDRRVVGVPTLLAEVAEHPHEAAALHRVAAITVRRSTT